MYIEKVECFLIGIPYHLDFQCQTDKEESFNAAKSQDKKLQSLLIKITADNGIVGWGEAFGHACNQASFLLLDKVLKPFFIGEQCDDIAMLMAKAQRAFHSYGRGGVMIYALSAFDIAYCVVGYQIKSCPLTVVSNAGRKF